MSTNIEIFIGTYEHYLLSYRFQDNDETTLERFLTHRNHNSPILCMDTYGRYLATGGADDRVVVIDLRTNHEIQLINRHKGTVNSLAFTTDGSHLLSCSEDGELVATKVGSWMTDYVWKKPHSGKGVIKICMHESGKVAFTLGKDGTMKLWDMVKGRLINTSNVTDLSEKSIPLDTIQLCPNGETFVLSGCKTVTVISTIKDKSYDELQLPSIVTSMCWIDNENLLVGMENGSIQWTNINKKEHENIPNVHTKRIKDMHFLNGYLGTASSTGDISLWRSSIPQQKLTLLATTNTGCRPICLKLTTINKDRFANEMTDKTKTSNESTESLTKNKPSLISTTEKVSIEMESDESTDSSIILISSNTQRSHGSRPKMIPNSAIKVTTNTSIKGNSQRKMSRSVDVSVSNSEDDFIIERNQRKKTKMSSSPNDKVKPGTQKRGRPPLKSSSNETPPKKTPEKQKSSPKESQKRKINDSSQKILLRSITKKKAKK